LFVLGVATFTSLLGVRTIAGGCLRVATITFQGRCGRGQGKPQLLYGFREWQLAYWRWPKPEVF